MWIQLVNQIGWLARNGPSREPLWEARYEISQFLVFARYKDESTEQSRIVSLSFTADSSSQCCIEQRRRRRKELTTMVNMKKSHHHHQPPFGYHRWKSWPGWLSPIWHRHLSSWYIRITSHGDQELTTHGDNEHWVLGNFVLLLKNALVVQK